MDSWNFHGHIALPLEEYGKTYFGSSCKTADEIECGEFVDTMISLLTIKLGSMDNLKDFAIKCRDYENLPASKIPADEARDLFEQFKQLMK